MPFLPALKVVPPVRLTMLTTLLQLSVAVLLPVSLYECINRSHDPVCSTIA